MRFTPSITRSLRDLNRFVICRFAQATLTPFVCVFLIVLNVGTTKPARAQTLRRSPEMSRIAVLVFGGAQTANATDERLRRQFASADFARVIDSELGGAAARGAGYTGSLNLTVEEARDIGAAIGCDYLLLADAQTIRRSSSATPVYYEAYASMFLVNARTGKLVAWRRPHQESLRETEATDGLLAYVTTEASQFLELIKEQRTTARGARTTAPDNANRADVENDANSFAATVAASESEDYREPQPYRRISPAYTEAAYKADAEATVDAQVDIDEMGEVVRVEIVRWAGFDLDESVARAIKAMHFRPAQLGGKATRARVLLRYNFRRPPRRSESEQQEMNFFDAPV